MTARIVLRKRIRRTPESLEALQRANSEPDSDRQRLRELADVFPHVVPSRDDPPKDDPYQKTPPIEPNPDNQLLAPDDAPEASEEGSEFLSVWGFVERSNPTRPRDEKAPWVDGRDPDTVRAGLLESPDLLTEVIVGERKPRGDLEVINDAQVPARERPALAVDVGVEVASYLNSGQHWETRLFAAPTFGTARDGMQMVGANWALDAEFSPDCENNGKDVNVVIVDTGLNEGYLRELVPDVDFRGGFVTRPERTYGPTEMPPDLPAGQLEERPLPGAFSDRMFSQGVGHGNMIARNILRIAPRARIFDAPLLPPRVTDIQKFTSDVEHLYEEIGYTRDESEFRDQPWIIVNAWAVANSINETTLGAQLNQYYTSGDAHNTTNLIQNMSSDFAIIFAAGNNGLFEPIQGAGLYDRGPFRVGEEDPSRLHGSISGANALPGVLTVGSCTVHGQWIGSSSMGDVPPALTALGVDRGGKPDLVAPSWFAETNDRHLTNTGTSAASGLVAGLAAASWSVDPTRSPQTLLQQMRDAAANNPFESQPAEAVPSARERLGHGIIHYPF